MFSWFRKLFGQVVAWFRPDNHGAAVNLDKILDRVKAIETKVAPLDPKPKEPRVRWIKPKGVEKLVHKPRIEKPEAEKPARPKTPKAPRPAPRPDENPEQWGRFFFRDAILNQLDVYFIYLRRMRHADRDAYEMHRRLGIQIMPESAVQSFDNWRSQGNMEELSAWWREHRPGFGAISYGIDKAGLNEERITTADMSPEQWAAADKKYGPRAKDKLERSNRVATITRGKDFELDGEKIKTGILWVPKFLYFHKWSKPPVTVQMVSDGDVYSMTVYWDRIDNHTSRKWQKRNKGGVPQSYAVCVERETGQVRVLRMMLNERIQLRHRRGADKGLTFTIPNKHWGIPTDYLSWATGRLDASPEDYLRRCFIEAALMYETAAVGSLIRVEATKGDLTATFGVEIKRTAYFFKDRDIITVTATGRRRPVFHIVRPHMRNTKHGPVPIKIQFRGQKEFNWAGYHIKITVPGLDHFLLPEIGLGLVDVDEHKKTRDRKLVGPAGIADRIKKEMNEWNRKET